METYCNNAFETGRQGYIDFIAIKVNRLPLSYRSDVECGQVSEEDLWENPYDPCSLDFEDYWDGWCHERDKTNWQEMTNIN